MREFNRGELLDVQEFLEIVYQFTDATNGRVSWKKAVPILNQIFEEKSMDGWRGMYRLVTSEEYRTQRAVNIAKRDHKRQDLYEIEHRLLRYIRRPRSLLFLSDFLRMEEADILAMITVLEAKYAQTVQKWEQEGQLMFQLVTKPLAESESFEIDLEVTDEITFGVVSDTHLCNVSADLELLHKIYDEFEDRGIEAVIHAGDVVDGRYLNRPNQLRELEHGCYDFDGQLDYAVENYPSREGITTYTLLGNHDFTFIRNAGANIVKAMCNLREDMVYIGDTMRDIKLGELDILVKHPTDGTTKYWSGKLQQHIDGAIDSSGKRPQVMLIGHYHKMVNMIYRGVIGFMLPSVTRQTSFMSTNNLVSQVGGLIITIKLNKDKIIGYNYEWVGMARNIA